MSHQNMNALLLAQRDKLPSAVSRTPWTGQPNEFAAALTMQQRGDLGEHFVADLLGAKVMPSNRPGHDVLLEANGWKIEVKTACENFDGNNREWNWAQLRHDDRHTHVCLVAISPDRVRVALLLRDEVFRMPGCYAQGKSGEHKQLKLTESAFAELHAKSGVDETTLSTLKITSPEV